MKQVNFGVIFIVVFAIAAEAYYHDEYIPDEKRFQGRKGDDFEPIVVEDVSRPHKWLRLKQRSEGLLEAYRRRGYTFPYRQRSSSRRYPMSNVYNQNSGWSSYEPYFQETRTYEKGPRTNTRGDEYARTSERTAYRQDTVKGRYGYPRETVQEIAHRFINGGSNFINSPDWVGREFRKKIQEKARRRFTDTEYQQSTRRQNDRQIYNRRTTKPPRVTTPPTTKAPRVKNSGVYQGCKDTGMYCTYWKSIGCCEQELGKKYCRKTCGLCSPQQTICPTSYKYGCCFDGTRALNYRKSNCRQCKDISRICWRWTVHRDCDLNAKNSLKTRAICPQTCGACFDYTTFA